MKRKYEYIKAYLLSLLMAFAMSIPAFAQDLPDRPTPPRLVVDYAGILTASEAQALENKLVRFNDTTSNQILVILTNDLMGNEIEPYASGIGDKWGVGQSGLDNGMVVVVKPKIGNDRGLAWISVGYGLGGAIPDITVGHIIDYELIPYFRSNNYYGGLDAATTVLMELAAGEYNSDEYASARGNPWWTAIPFIVFFIFFILITSLSRRSRTMGSKSMSPWAAFWLGSMIGGGGSSWGGSSGSSFGGGGSSFGGFGGGGFGGGGAGGSW